MTVARNNRGVIDRIGCAINGVVGGNNGVINGGVSNRGVNNRGVANEGVSNGGVNSRGVINRTCD